MTGSSRYEVGYGRPPKGTRWQAGQCGNPKRIRKQNPKSIVDMIDEFFAGEIDIVEKRHIAAGRSVRSHRLAALDQGDGRKEAGHERVAAVSRVCCPS